MVYTGYTDDTDESIMTADGSSISCHTATLHINIDTRGDNCKVTGDIFPVDGHKANPTTSILPSA